ALAEGRGVRTDDRVRVRAVVALDASVAHPHDPAAVGEPAREVRRTRDRPGERRERTAARDDEPWPVVEDTLERHAAVRVDADVLGVDASQRVAADRLTRAHPAGRR